MRGLRSVRISNIETKNKEIESFIDELKSIKVVGNIDVDRIMHRGFDLFGGSRKACDLLRKLLLVKPYARRYRSIKLIITLMKTALSMNTTFISILKLGGV